MSTPPGTAPASPYGRYTRAHASTVALQRASDRASPSGLDSALADMMARHLTAADAPVIVLGGNAVASHNTIIRNGVRRRRSPWWSTGPTPRPRSSRDTPRRGSFWSNADRAGRSASPFGRENGRSYRINLASEVPPCRETLVTLNAAFGQIRDGAPSIKVTSAPHPVQKNLLDRLCLDACRVDATDADDVPFALYRLTRKPAASWLQPAPVTNNAPRRRDLEVAPWCPSCHAACSRHCRRVPPGRS